MGKLKYGCCIWRHFFWFFLFFFLFPSPSLLGKACLVLTMRGSFILWNAASNDSHVESFASIPFQFSRKIPLPGSVAVIYLFCKSGSFFWRRAHWREVAASICAASCLSPPRWLLAFSSSKGPVQHSIPTVLGQQEHRMTTFVDHYLPKCRENNVTIDFSSKLCCCTYRITRFHTVGLCKR